MIEFSIDITELKRLAMLMPQLEDAILDEMAKAMTESGMLLTTLVSSRIGAKSTDRGLLRAAVQWPSGFTESVKGSYGLEGLVKATSNASISGVATSIYANYVEFGTRPHWPPREPLRAWALRKFGDEQIGDRVAFAISQRGTYAKGNFFLAWHYDGGRSKVTAIWKKIPVKVIRKWDRMRK